jgi:hypothetical protein
VGTFGALDGSRQQIKKRRTLMKTQTLFVGLCLVVGLAAIPTHAQVFEARARVPFSFVVLGKTFPAGEYTLLAAPHMVKIEDANQTLIAVVLANETPGRSAGATGQIIFHCYSDYCFLSELRSPIQGNGRQLLTSRSEAKLAKKEQGNYFAVLGEKPRHYE